MLDKIDELCDDFETALRQSGGEGSVRIEDFLARAPDEIRPKLLRELLEIEIEYSATQNQEESNELPLLKLQDSLKSRFPEQADLVDSVVRRVVKLRQIGDYDILEELGHGGMGIVYRARQKLLNQVVAVKVLSQTLLDDPQAVGRFRREMQLIGGLNHPNIVRALNAGESDGMHYLVMEFVDGITLQRLCDTIRKDGEKHNASTNEFLNAKDSQAGRTVAFEKQEANSKTRQTPFSLAEKGTTNALPDVPSVMPIAAACEAIRQAALGMAHAHQYGLVHRDIKPANLMLDRSGVVKVLDLGLGKFLAEKRISDDEASLTMAGTTIGTIDYISPEQCENAGAADIRADIYSLGCTFYFLATGRVPYSGSRYDTTRKKLMAHMVAEAPKLGKSLLDVPPELEAVLEKMLAKEPDERFQTPLEVAEAFAPFASLEALYALLGEHALHPIGIHAPGSTSRRIDATKTLAGRSKTNVEKIRVFSKILSWIALVILIMSVGSVIGIRYYIYHSTDAEHRPTTTDGADAPAVTASPKVIAQTDLTLLPGLYGNWWFEETPWFLPCVRELLYQEIEMAQADGDIKTVLGEKPEQYLDINIPAVRSWLWQIVEKRLDKLPPKQRELVEKLHELDVADQSEEVALEESLELLTAADKNEGYIRVSVLHGMAVLEHRLAVLRNDKELAQKAASHYAEALDRYRKDGPLLAIIGQSQCYVLLELLCQSDAARLEHLATGSYEQAIEKFEAARTKLRTFSYRSPLFNAELQATYGMFCAGAGQYKNETLTRAIDSLKQSRLGNNHPLAAQLAERYGWSLLDQWRMVEAEKQFLDAVLIRAANQRESGDPPADVYLWRDWHALAAVLRYLDRPRQAVEEFRKTLDSIDKYLAENAEGIGTNFQAKACERAANTRERLADCTLYGGAASGLGQARLQEMAKLYGEAAKLYANDSSKRVALAKQAIAHSLLDDLVEAERILCELDEKQPERFGKHTRPGLTHQLAAALFSYKKSGGDDETKAPLRQFLEQFTIRSNPTFAEATRRENLELRLFCAEFLVAQTTEDTIPPLMRARDLLALAQIARFFQNYPESRPFMRRIHETIIRHYARLYENQPHGLIGTAPAPRDIYADGILSLIEWMRYREPRPGATAETASCWVAFFLTNDAKDGFVLFRLLEGVSRSARLFRLPLTRNDIKMGLAKDDPRRKLDPELLKLIDAARKEGRNIAIYWDDSPSWRRPEDALTEADWPFEEGFRFRDEGAGIGSE